MFFNEKLKMLRKESNLTQEELAERLNVSRQAITKWESGDGTPDIENLKQISILFNTTIDELIKEKKIVTVESKVQYSYVQELDIDHTESWCRLATRCRFLRCRHTRADGRKPRCPLRSNPSRRLKSLRRAR